MKYVVADFESTPQKIIHSLSFIPVVCTETKQWVSHGRGTNPEYRKHRHVTRGILRTIFIEESLTHELVQNSERTIRRGDRHLLYRGPDAGWESPAGRNIAFSWSEFCQSI